MVDEWTAGKIIFKISMISIIYGLIGVTFKIVTLVAKLECKFGVTCCLALICRWN